MAYKFVYFHYDRIVYVLSNVSSLQRLIPMFFLFPIYFLCFHYTDFVSNVRCTFPIFIHFFQAEVMFPNGNVSNVCFQYTWSRISGLGGLGLGEV